MVNYECQRCGYSTINKTMFKRHLLRKNLCKVELDDIDRYKLLKMNNFDEEAKNYEKSAKNPPKLRQTTPKSAKKCSNYVCSHCNKVFTRSDSLKKHIDFRCKLKKNELEKKDVIIKELKESNEELKMMIEKLLNNNININNGTINTANRDINTTNIQINNYGSENIDYITDKVFKKLLEKPVSAITRLIELKHFNPNHPENHNVKITNIHDKYAKIYQDKKWLVKHKKDIVEELVENGYADFEEFKDLNEDELAEKIKEKYKLMKQNYNNNFDKICKKSELSIINESKKSIEV